MDNLKSKIDWNSSELFFQILNGIKTPLEVIKKVSLQDGVNITAKKEVLFTSSQEISNLIEEILEKIQAKSLKIHYKDSPLIFQIFESNAYVQSLCQHQIVPEQISKTDQSWLLQLENEIFKTIDKYTLNLYDLSYKMAVSERQLHRKVKRLIYLTPNKYIRILKLNKAKELIDNYVFKSISQIAYAVGYSDTYYFSKLFEDQYNVSPKALLS